MGVYTVGRSNGIDHACEKSRFAAIALLVSGDEPVPATVQIPGAALLWIEHQEGVIIGKRIEMCSRSEGIRILRTSMECHEQWSGCAIGIITRDIELIRARAWSLGEGPAM